jgi:hypothetical protein
MSMVLNLLIKAIGYFVLGYPIVVIKVVTMFILSYELKKLL